jgi:hypothetical protein
MHTARQLHTATLLPDGTVLIAGGGGSTPAPTPSVLSSAELYDPVTSTFTPTGDMTLPRCCHTATLLNDGRVLIVGRGVVEQAGIHGTASAEIYTPPVLVPAPVLSFLLSGDGRGQGAIEHDDSHQLVTADNPAVAEEIIVIYCTGLSEGSVIPPQVTIGGRLAEVLFFGDAPANPGRRPPPKPSRREKLINVRVPSGLAPGPAVSVRLNYLGRPSNAVTIGLR